MALAQLSIQAQDFLSSELHRYNFRQKLLHKQSCMYTQPNSLFQSVCSCLCCVDPSPHPSSPHSPPSPSLLPSLLPLILLPSPFLPSLFPLTPPPTPLPSFLPLPLSQGEEEETGVTSPYDLWAAKPLEQQKWYLQPPTEIKDEGTSVDAPQEKKEDSLGRGEQV